MRAGNSLSIEYAVGALRLTPVKDLPDLDELIEQIQPSNVHEEADFGAPVGKEVW